MTQNLLRSERRDGVLLLTLARGRGNTLQGEFLRAIAQRLAEAAGDPPRGLVLTAEGSVFSAGLDLFALAELDRAAMAELVRELYAVERALFAFPRPVVAALNGHAIAGGLLLALCCDARLLQQGDARVGLNESALGLAMPAHTMPLLQYALRRPIVEKLCYGGQLYPTYKAQDMGIVDELVEADELIERAIEWVEDWTPSPSTFAANKARLKADTLVAMESARAHDEAWLDLWFSEPAQAALAAARRQLKERSA